MLDGYDDILTVEQLMELLNIGKNVAYKILNSKEIPSFRIGRVHKIPKKCVMDYILKKCSNRTYDLLD